MNAAFFITFREGLEAALIVGILFAAMKALGAQKKNFVIWIGALVGLLLSLFFAWGFAVFTSGFTGTTEKVYEGILMFLAAGIITHLIFWMRREGKLITARLNKKVKDHLTTGSLWAIGCLAAIAVAREGIEMVIFFQALFVQSEQSISILSGLVGVLSAVALACLIFFSTRKVPVAKLFNVLAWVLIVIAGGLIAHGIVELQGANMIPTFVKPLFDLSAILSENAGLGSILKAGFGYDANPSLLAVIGYVLYLIVVGSRYAKK